MEQELTTPVEQTLAEKIYKDKAIYVATFLGGPLTSGYLIANNFKVFNEPNKVTKTWIYAIAATMIIFGGIFLIPNIENIPNEIIPVIYTTIAYYLVKYFQGEKIETHINSGGLTFGWGRTILISVVI